MILYSYLDPRIKSEGDGKGKAPKGDGDAFLYGTDINLNSGSDLTLTVVQRTAEDDPTKELDIEASLEGVNITADGAKITFNDNPEVNDDGTEAGIYASSIDLKNTTVTMNGGEVEAWVDLVLDHATVTASMADIQASHPSVRPFYGLDPDDKREVLAGGDLELYHEILSDAEWSALKAKWDKLSDAQKIAEHDQVAQSARSGNGGKLDIISSEITMANGAEITRANSGDINVDNSTITLNKGKQTTSTQYSAVISHEGVEGDIVIKNESNVTLNGNSGIIRGVYDWAGNAERDDTKTFDWYKELGNSTMLSRGRVILNMAELTMNDDSFIALSDMEEDAGGMFVQNSSTVNVNGDNKIWTNAVEITGNSTVNIAEGATLSVVDAFKKTSEGVERYGTGGFNMEKGSILNLYGTLNADLGVDDENEGLHDGTINILSSNAKLEGSINGGDFIISKDWTLDRSGEDARSVSRIGSITANANVTLNLPMEPALENGHSGLLNVGNVTVAEGKALSITSNGTSAYVPSDFENEFYANVSATSLTLGKGSTLDLKDVYLGANMDSFQADQVTINLDNAGVGASNKENTFTNSNITMKNNSEMGAYGWDPNTGMDENSGIITLDNTTVTATDSGFDPNYLNIKNKSNVTITNGWVDSLKDLVVDNSTLTANTEENAKNTTWIMPETVIVRNGGRIDLNNSTMLSGVNLEDGTINVNSSIFGLGSSGWAVCNSADCSSEDEDGNYIQEYIAAQPLVLDGGVVNIEGNSTLVGKSIDVGNTFNVKEGAVLATSLSAKEKADILDNSTFSAQGDKVALNVTEGGVLTNNGTIDADVTNAGKVVNNDNATISGNFTNNGEYTGLISGVTGTFTNNNVVNTRGELTKGLLGTTNLIKASSLAKSLKFGKVSVKDSLDIGTNILTADSVEFADNSTLAFRISGEDNFGKVVADTIKISENGTTLKLNLDQDVLAKDETKEFQILDGNISGSFAKLGNDTRYKFVDKGNGLFEITYETTVAEAIEEVGGDTSDQETAGAWLEGTGFKPGSTAEKIFTQLKELFDENVSIFKKAMDALKPDSAPTGQAIATAINNQIASVLGGRFGAPAPQGRAAGENFKNAGLWAQALANKSKLSTSQGFNGKTYGLALGGDAEVAEGLKVGLGYAYTNSDVDATGRSTDVGTHTAIIYAEKAIGDAFVNGMTTYSRSEYEESKNVGGTKVKADYDADAIYAQAMGGYNFYVKNAMLTPEAGLRYLWTNTHSYTDSADQSVKADKTNTLTGVIGGRASMAFQTGETVITPEFKLAATYDIKSDKGGASVRLANGSSYTVSGDALNRFGVETGAKIGMTVNNMEFSLNYEGKFKKDYQDHTGMINFRYNF